MTINRETALRIARAAREFRDERENLVAWLDEFGVGLSPDTIADIREGLTTPRALERRMRDIAREYTTVRQAHSELVVQAAWDLALDEMRTLGFVRTPTMVKIAYAKCAPDVLYVIHDFAANEGPPLSAYRVERSALRTPLLTYPTGTWRIDGTGIHVTCARKVMGPRARDRFDQPRGGRAVASTCVARLRLGGTLIREGGTYRRPGGKGHEKYLAVVIATPPALERAS